MTDVPCAQDPEFWFPPSQASSTDIRTAKALCAGCEVRAKCLKFALDNHIRDGIWGGMTRLERVALKRQIKAKPVERPYRMSAPLETMTVDTTAVGPGSVAAPNRGLADRMDTTD